MSELLTTPTDELTGLPWSIIPSKNIHRLHGTDKVNRNHAFHPKLDPRLQTLGGKALRVCRIQEVEDVQHNYGNKCYHSFYSGPPISENEIEQFRTIIYALSGYIPEWGIELSGGEPVERLINNKEMAILRTISDKDYKYIHFGDSAIRLFVKKIILDKSVFVDTAKLDRFLSTKDIDIRRRLGMEVLRQASDIASLEVGSEYKTMYEKGLLKPNAANSPAAITNDVIRNEIRVEKSMFNQLTKVAEKVLANAA